jgi:hypothetical protein
VSASQSFTVREPVHVRLGQRRTGGADQHFADDAVAAHVDERPSGSARAESAPVAREVPRDGLVVVGVDLHAARELKRHFVESELRGIVVAHDRLPAVALAHRREAAGHGTHEVHAVGALLEVRDAVAVLGRQLVGEVRRRADV